MTNARENEESKPAEQLHSQGDWLIYYGDEYLGVATNLEIRDSGDTDTPTLGGTK